MKLAAAGDRAGAQPAITIRTCAPREIDERITKWQRKTRIRQSGIACGTVVIEIDRVAIGDVGVSTGCIVSEIEKVSAGDSSASSAAAVSEVEINPSFVPNCCVVGIGIIQENQRRAVCNIRISSGTIIMKYDLWGEQIVVADIGVPASAGIIEMYFTALIAQVGDSCTALIVEKHSVWRIDGKVTVGCLASGEDDIGRQNWHGKQEAACRAGEEREAECRPRQIQTTRLRRHHARILADQRASSYVRPLFGAI
ncbi:hypothetical protein OIU35_07690 [Boseaceae bacterium BT-24-1]|nr:hypothetical protein [Boseaceae bacterium BT-24-1]